MVMQGKWLWPTLKPMIITLVELELKLGDMGLFVLANWRPICELLHVKCR